MSLRIESSWGTRDELSFRDEDEQHSDGRIFSFSTGVKMEKQHEDSTKDQCSVVVQGLFRARRLHILSSSRIVEVYYMREGGQDFEYTGTTRGTKMVGDRTLYKFDVPLDASLECCGLAVRFASLQISKSVLEIEQFQLVAQLSSIPCAVEANAGKAKTGNIPELSSMQAPLPPSCIGPNELSGLIMMINSSQKQLEAKLTEQISSRLKVVEQRLSSIEGSIERLAPTKSEKGILAMEDMHKRLMSLQKEISEIKTNGHAN